jgi:hypothetical protein
VWPSQSSTLAPCTCATIQLDEGVRVGSTIGPV